MKHNPGIAHPPDVFIKRNMRLVYKICNKYRRWLKTHTTYADFEDLVQVGCMALMHVYEHFDHTKYDVKKISTYAGRCIDGYILRFMENINEGPTFPHLIKQLANKAKKLDLQDKSVREIASSLEVTEDVAYQVKEYFKNARSLPIAKRFNKNLDHEATLEELFFEDFSTHEDFEEGLIVEEYMRTLLPREVKVARLILQGYSGAEIGRMLDLTRSRVSAILQDVMRKADIFARSSKEVESEMRESA